MRCRLLGHGRRNHSRVGGGAFYEKSESARAVSIEPLSRPAVASGTPGAYARAVVFWRNKPAIDDADWERVCSDVPVVRRLGVAQQEELRALADRFLRTKTFEACGGLELTQTMRLEIAAVACVPILALGLDAYRQIHSILVYPDEFRSKWKFEDEHGIVSEEDGPLSGEAWPDGPVVLSWFDIASGGGGESGYNVVIHEFAHKLDMLTGAEDGVPPLPGGVEVEIWQRDFAAARADLARRESAGDEPPIDPYAADSAAESFAVFSEAFFEIPDVLEREYPAVSAHLRAFYSAGPAG